MESNDLTIGIFIFITSLCALLMQLTHFLIRDVCINNNLSVEMYAFQPNKLLNGYPHNYRCTTVIYIYI